MKATKESKKITEVLNLLTSIYNQTKNGEKRKSITSLARNAGLVTSYASLIKTVLSKRNICFFGNGKCEWNMEMSEPNEMMARSIMSEVLETNRIRYGNKKSEDEPENKQEENPTIKGISIYSDIELAEELRRRGYDLVAEKHIVL